VIQIAGKLARRIVSFLKVNDTVAQWDIIWLIKFGSQVTIVFDKNVEVVAKVWDIVIDGETILWRLVR
jgi:phosphatidylserine decarboxylase